MRFSSLIPVGGNTKSRSSGEMVVQIKMQNLFRSTFTSLIFISLLTPLAYSSALAARDVSVDQNRSAKRVIEVDYSKIKGPHNQFFREVVGAGRAAEGLRADWQRDLAPIHRECGFKYIRFHGLLQDELGVYSEDRQGRPVYNFQYIDALYDAILNIGMKPFVELSFMPQALSSGAKTVFWWKGNITPPIIASGSVISCSCWPPSSKPIPFTP